MSNRSRFARERTAFIITQCLAGLAKTDDWTGFVVRFIIESEYMNRPARVSFWWVAADEFEQSCLGIAIEFWVVFAVGLAGMNRREPSAIVVLHGKESR